MKAVVMAGGEGTRLRPMTANQPKPLLPVVNRPIMEHVLRLLKRHGFTETVVTVQFLAALIRNYFGDGEELGMSLQLRHRGDAARHRRQRQERRGARCGTTPFLVISGDALTDIDLTDMVRFHRENGALVTIGLKRVPNPLEFGIIIVDDDGRVQRFLEKPTWGQVFSDTVNTGIYIMEPEVLDQVAAGESGRLVRRRLPQAAEARAPRCTATSPTATGRTSAPTRATSRPRPTCCPARSTSTSTASRCRPGVWVAEGAEVDPEAVLKGPLYIGDYAKVEAGCRAARVHGARQQRRREEGAFLHRAVVHDNVYVGPAAPTCAAA